MIRYTACVCLLSYQTKQKRARSSKEMENITRSYELKTSDKNNEIAFQLIV